MTILIRDDVFQPFHVEDLYHVPLFPIGEIDLNPVKGCEERLHAVDARIIMDVSVP
ncbi:MAG TPA: hypothetical protein PLR60_01215 [Syntrophorhabdaceae bacterium]|nr:hypothetical protein [Syntrophorhabdaceae bacterium]